ncbi:DMT family transporter [Vibrio sp. HN007]|uniref:DMT family transporter n=1 Tax=Vibrio iocasae TaxID=3098914 RepID=UPI0035D4DA0E
MPSEYRPALFMLVSTLSLSVNGLAAKYLAALVSTEWLSFIRFLIPAFLVFLILSFSKIRVPHRSMWTPLITRGISIAACQVCFLIALEKLTLVESVVLFATGPLFIPLLERIFFGVKVRLITKVGLLLTFFGVVLLAGNPSGLTIKPELLWGLAAGVCNAGSQLSLFRSSKSALTPLEINAWGFTIAAVCILPLLITNGLSSEDIATITSPTEHLDVWAAVVALALLIINTQYFRAKAYQLVSNNSQLAPLIFTNLIFTALWQKLFFNDEFTAYQVWGIALIIGASMIQVLVVSSAKSKNKSQLAHR